MSFWQIFDRMSRIARSYSYADSSRHGDDLRRAEELIEEERRRDEREHMAAQQQDLPQREGEADQKRAAYLQAIAILSVADGASWEEIMLAYRRLVRLSHPDRSMRRSREEQERAARRTQELNMAYAYLRDVHGKR